MTDSLSLFIFRIDLLRFAVPLESVQRVVRAVEITPLPDGSGAVLGVINLHGRIVPAINSRRLMGLPERGIVADDLFIIADTACRTVALVADAVEPVAALPEKLIIPAEAVVNDPQHLAGIARLDDAIVIIQNLELCISAADEQLVDRFSGSAEVST